MSGIHVDFDPKSLPPNVLQTLRSEAVRRGVTFESLLQEGAVHLARRINETIPAAARPASLKTQAQS